MGYHVLDDVAVSDRISEPICRLPQVSLPGHRFYSPCQGRWLSRDPIEEPGFAAARTASPEQVRMVSTKDGLNLFALLDNDPIRDIDVLGLGRNDPPPCAPYPDCMSAPPGAPPPPGGGWGCPGYSSCCSKSACLTAVKEAHTDCVEWWSGACTVGCGWVCRRARIRSVCMVQCAARCSAAAWIGCTLAAGVCYAACMTCDLP